MFFVTINSNKMSSQLVVYKFFLMLFKHPMWNYYAKIPIENGVHCLVELNLFNSSFL